MEIYLLVTGFFINSEDKSMVFAFGKLKFTERIKLAVIITRFEVESTARFLKSSLLSTATVLTRVRVIIFLLFDFFWFFDFFRLFIIG